MLTTTEENEDEQKEVCAKEPTRRLSQLSRKENQNLSEQLGEDRLGNLSMFFDKSLLAELFSVNAWMIRLRILVERGNKQGLQLMGSYKNTLWNQRAVSKDCILVDTRLAVPIKLQPAVMNEIIEDT